MSSLIDSDELKVVQDFVEKHKAGGCDIGYQADRVRAYNPCNYQTVAEMATPLGGVVAMMLIEERFGVELIE